MLTAASLVGVALNGQIDPVYGLPNAALGILPSWNPVLDVLPWLMIVIGAALIIFTLFALWKRYWKISGRIHYTLFTASAWIVLLLFMYWQLIS
ncbi:hypothetical protein D3C77_686770 [compost metagenome]